MRTCIIYIVTLGGLFLPASCTAALMEFEGLVSDGQVANVGPNTVYYEAGFQLRPTNQRSNIYDAMNPDKMIGGNETDYLAFEVTNAITLTRENDLGLFNFGSLLAGRTSQTSSAADITITGNFGNGTTITQLFSNIDADAQLIVLNWQNLASIVLTTTGTVGIDNLDVSVVPEPTSLQLAASALLMAALRMRRL